MNNLGERYSLQGVVHYLMQKNDRRKPCAVVEGALLGFVDRRCHFIVSALSSAACHLGNIVKKINKGVKVEIYFYL